MPSIYCDICGQEFRKGKTFHEHLKRSKCTRISVLMSVLHQDNGLEINNPDREDINSPEKRSQDHISTTPGENTDIDTTSVKQEAGEIDSNTNNHTNEENDDFDKTKIKEDPETSVDFRPDVGASKINESFSDTDSYTSNTGYEEIQVTAYGDIPVSDLDNSRSDWSDDVDWDLLESQGKVDTVIDPRLLPIHTTEGNTWGKGKNFGSKSPGFSKNVAETCKTQKRQPSLKTNEAFEKNRNENKKKSDICYENRKKRKKKSNGWYRKKRKLSGDAEKVNVDAEKVRIETDVSSSEQEDNSDDKVTQGKKKTADNYSGKDNSKMQTNYKAKGKEKNKRKTIDKVPTSIQTDSESDSEQNLELERSHRRKQFKQTSINKYFSSNPSPNHADRQKRSKSKEKDTKGKGENIHEVVKQKLKKKLLSQTKDNSSDNQDSNEESDNSENKSKPQTKQKGRLTTELKQLLLAQREYRDKTKSNVKEKRSGSKTKPKGRLSREYKQLILAQSEFENKAETDVSKNKPSSKTTPKGRLSREYTQLILAQSTHKDTESKSTSRSNRRNKSDIDSDDESPVQNIRSTRQNNQSKEPSTRQNNQTKGPKKKLPKGSGQKKKMTSVTYKDSDEDSVDSIDGDTNDSDFNIDKEDGGSDTDSEREQESDSGSIASRQSSGGQGNKGKSKKPRKTKGDINFKESKAYKTFQPYANLSDKMRLDGHTPSALKKMLKGQNLPLLLINRPVFLVNNQSKQLLLECGICQKVYQDKYMFEEHVKSHAKNVEIDNSEFICGICSRVFDCEDKLTHHMSVHVSKPTPPRGDNKETDKVTTPLSSPTQLEKSKKQDIDNDAQFICGRCKEKFSDSSSLVKHMLRHVISPNGPSKNRSDNHLIVPSLAGNYLNKGNQQMTVQDSNPTKTLQAPLVASSTVDVSDPVSSSSNLPDSSNTDLSETAALGIDDHNYVIKETGNLNLDSEMNKINDGAQSISVVKDHVVYTNSVNNGPTIVPRNNASGTGVSAVAQTTLNESRNVASSMSSENISFTKISEGGSTSIAGALTTSTYSRETTSTSVSGTTSNFTSGIPSESMTTSTGGNGITSSCSIGTGSTNGVNEIKSSGNTGSDMAAGRTNSQIVSVIGKTGMPNKNVETKKLDEAEILKLKNEKKKKTISKLMKYKPSFLKPSISNVCN